MGVATMYAAQLQQRQRLPGQLVQVGAHVVLVPAGAGDNVSVFRTKHQQHVSHDVNVVATGYGHRQGERREQIFGVIGAVVVQVVWGFRGVHGDHRLLRCVPVFNMIGSPGVFCLIFGDAIGVLAGVTEGGAILVAGQRAAQVGEGQLNGPPDGGVSTVALSETVAAAVHAQFSGGGPVDDHQGRSNMRRTLHRSEVEPRQQQRLDGCDYNWKILGQATRHDCVGGQLFHGSPSSARGNLTDEIEGRTAYRFKKRPHTIRSGRNDGQPVRPPCFVGQRQRFVVFANFNKHR